MKQKLIKAIQEANPELLELSFGCEVECNNRKWIYTRKYLGKIVLMEKDQWKPIDMKNEIFDVFDDISKYKILGHQIRLSHVLKAMTNFYAADGTGTFFKIKTVSSENNDWTMECQEARWNLENDDLQWHIENKPEVIKFLEEIIL